MNKDVLELILSVVCRRLGVEREDVLSGIRLRSVVEARTFTNIIARDGYSVTFTDISSFLNLRTHSTSSLMHKRYHGIMSNNRALREAFEGCMAECLESIKVDEIKKSAQILRLNYEIRKIQQQINELQNEAR